MTRKRKTSKNSIDSDVCSSRTQKSRASTMESSVEGITKAKTKPNPKTRSKTVSKPIAKPITKPISKAKPKIVNKTIKNKRPVPIPRYRRIINHTPVAPDCTKCGAKLSNNIMPFIMITSDGNGKVDVEVSHPRTECFINDLRVSERGIRVAIKEDNDSDSCMLYRCMKRREHFVAYKQVPYGIVSAVSNMLVGNTIHVHGRYCPSYGDKRQITEYSCMYVNSCCEHGDSAKKIHANVQKTQAEPARESIYVDAPDSDDDFSNRTIIGESFSWIGRSSTRRKISQKRRKTLHVPMYSETNCAES